MYKRTFNPCDECKYGIDRRDGSGSDRMCKICEFSELLKLCTQPENEPIVHCAECEHYTPSPMGGNGCLIRFNGRTEIIPRNPTDFCSHGERKPERSEG